MTLYRDRKRLNADRTLVRCGGDRFSKPPADQHRGQIGIRRRNDWHERGVGHADVGGGAGIFRPKNPETKNVRIPKKDPEPKKRPAKPLTPVTNPSHRTTSRKTTKSANVEDRVEELLDKGNQSRDARKFSEAEEAYQSVLKIKPGDA